MVLYNKNYSIYRFDFRILFLFCLPLFYMVLTSSGGSSTPAWQQENVSFLMMDIEINATMKEHQRQKQMREHQTTNLVIESANRKQWSDLNEKVTKIQDRLRIVSFAIQSIPAGIALSREITKITDNQTAIISEVNDAPYSIISVLPSQIQFVDDMQMVIRLISGIILSYGAINQMEQSERKLLIDYALDEVKTLSRNSSHLLMKIRDIKAKIKRNKNAFQYYVNRDRKVVEDIMYQIKTF